MKKFLSYISVKKVTSYIAAIVGSAIVAAAVLGQVNSPQMKQFQPGFREIDGSQLNLMLNSLINLTNYDYKNVTASPDTYTVGNKTGIVIFDVIGGSPLTQETVTAPAQPFDGQIVTVASRVTITTFAFVANTGQTLAASTPTVLTASTTAPQGYRWIYRATDAKWYRIY
jgi:hypothetical protein